MTWSKNGIVLLISTCIIRRLPIASMNRPDIKHPIGTNNMFTLPIHEICCSDSSKSGWVVELSLDFPCRPGIKMVGYPNINPQPIRRCKLHKKEAKAQFITLNNFRNFFLYFFFITLPNKIKFFTPTTQNWGKARRNSLTAVERFLSTVRRRVATPTVVVFVLLNNIKQK